jgi:predicted  nucleic acid-binding Zn-ribbon protein
MALSKEKDQLIKQRDSAVQEAHMWRSELAKARDRAVILEATVVRAEEKVRVADADAEARIKDAAQKESTAVREKQELLAYVNKLQSQLQRFSNLTLFGINPVCHSCLTSALYFMKKDMIRLSTVMLEN